MPQVIAPRAGSDGAETSSRRDLETRLQALPLPPIPREHPRIGHLRGRGSLAIGTTRDGFVVRCRPIPLEGPHHRVLSVQASRGTNCGTDELVAALLRAAESVAKRYPGAVLPIGNLSRHGGGDIPWSISHNAGRDADIGFYLTGPDGRQVVPDDLVRVDSSGRAEVAGVPVRLDVKRTWWFVRSLLTDPEVEVQWVFVSRPIRAMLLEHARGRGEPAALVAKAAEALAQPRRALPHDDHLHVRVYCAPDDLYEGCRDAGTHRTWYVARPERVEARVRELAPLLRSASKDTRIAAMTVLGRLDRREHLPTFVRWLGDSDPVVRLAAARTLREMGVTGVEDAVVRVVAHGSDRTILPILLEALNRTLTGTRRVEVLSRLLDVHHAYSMNLEVFEIRRSVAEWALEEIEASPLASSVPVLVRALRRPGVDQEAVHRALVRMTACDPTREARGDVVAAWEGWWRVHSRQSPERWHHAGLRRAGVLSPEPIGPGMLDALVSAVEGVGGCDESIRRASWSLLRGLAARISPGWKRPWPADSIAPWGTLARAIVASLGVQTAQTSEDVAQ